MVAPTTILGDPEPQVVVSAGGGLVDLAEELIDLSLDDQGTALEVLLGRLVGHAVHLGDDLILQAKAQLEDGDHALRPHLVDRENALGGEVLGQLQPKSLPLITGDGDALSIGGNHLMHCIRRNLDINIVLFNNRIYGLTKGQYSPTSPLGKVTKSTPMGAIDNPIHPLSVAIGCDGTFVARSIDVNIKHLGSMLKRAAEHRGTSFIEVYQNCNVFNDGAWDYATDRATRADNVVELEHGKPLIFGKDRDKGIRLNGMEPEVVELGKGITEDDLLFHDEKAVEPSLAYLLSRMRHPEFPEPIGVFRAIDAPKYDELLNQQVDDAREKQGDGDLETLFTSGNTWTVT